MTRSSQTAVMLASACALVLGFSFVETRAQTSASLRNPSLLRTIEGRYENRETKSGRVLGTETFRINAYADGSRCILIWSNSASRGTQISANVCVDSTFRPTDAYARYWLGGKYRGTAWLNVAGNELSVVSTVGGPVTSVAIKVPDRFSVGTHPISGDAWHVAAIASPRGAEATSFTFDPSGDRSTPLQGSLVKIPVEYLPAERVTVPAGTFDVRRFRLAGRTEYWVTGDDWVVVKSGGGESERVLVSLQSN